MIQLISHCPTIFHQGIYSQLFKQFAIQIPKPTSYKIFKNDPNLYSEQNYALYQKDKLPPNVTKPKYIASINPKYRKKIEEKEFQLYQQELRQNIIKKINSDQEEQQKEKEQATLEKDDLWGTQPVPKRHYEKIIGKERYWLSRPENYYEQGLANIKFLQGFSKIPYSITNQEIRSTIDQIKKLSDSQQKLRSDPNYSIEDFYLSNKEVAPLFQKLVLMSKQVHFSEIPHFAMALSYELGYKIDHFKLWKSLYGELNKSLYHYSTMDLIKIRFATACTYPKIGDSQFHKKIIDLLKQELHLLRIEELLHALYSFRYLKKDKIHTLIINEILNHKKAITYPDQFAHILYTYSISRIPDAVNMQKMRKLSSSEEIAKVLQSFYEEVNDSIMKMSIEGVSYLAMALFLLKNPHYGDLLLRIERRVLQLISQTPSDIKATNAYQLVYAFSKMNQSIGFGSEQFYISLLEFIKKYWSQYTNLEKSRIFYAYSQMELVDPERLNNFYLPWIRQEMPNFKYNELQNVVYGLMFNNIVEKELWRQYIFNICKQPLVVPVYNYFPIKLSKYYLKQLFPKWNLTPFDEACYDAEVHFNVTRLQKNYQTQEFKSLGTMLYQKLELNVKAALEFDNTFIIDFVIMPQKVAILQQEQHYTSWDGKKQLPIFKLKCKILENCGWKVITVNLEEFKGREEQKLQELVKKVEESFKVQDKVYKDNYWNQYQRVFDKISDLGVRGTHKHKRNLDIWDEDIEVTDPKPPESSTKLTEQQKEKLNAYIKFAANIN